MRLWKENLLVQFSVISFLVMATLAVLLSFFLANSVRDHILDEAVADARDAVSTKVLRHVGAGDLDEPFAGDRLQAFHGFVTESILSQRTARVKLWSGQRVLYSDDFSQIGTTYPMSHELAEALDGRVAREISIPQKAENERERLMGTLIEVYAPMVFPGNPQVKGVFEIYQYYAPYAGFISSQRRLVFVSVFTGFAVLYLALFFLVARGWRAIRAAHQRTERSLQEVQGLNKLLFGYLEQRQHLIDEVRSLDAQPPPFAGSDPEFHRFYEALGLRVKHIAEEASGFPSPPTARGA